MTLPCVWTVALAGRSLTYRLDREDSGGYVLAVKPAGSTDDAYRPATRSGGHSMALRVGDLLREEEETKIIHISERRRA